MQRSRLVPLLIVACAAIVGCDGSRSAPTPPGSPPASASAEPAPRPASAAAVSLLGGLKAGDKLAEWAVVSLTMTDDPNMPGAIAIDLRKGDKSATIWVAKKGQSQFHPPRQTKAFDIFFGPAGVDDAELGPAVDAVVGRVSDNEQNTPGGGML